MQFYHKGTKPLARDKKRIQRSSLRALTPSFSHDRPVNAHFSRRKINSLFLSPSPSSLSPLLLLLLLLLVVLLLPLLPVLSSVPMKKVIRIRGRVPFSAADYFKANILRAFKGITKI